jgi:hypothetical protein
MTLTTDQATTRARWRRELHRLHARPFELGPFDVLRHGTLLAAYCGFTREITPELVDALAELPDAAGPDAVRHACLVHRNSATPAVIDRAAPSSSAPHSSGASPARGGGGGSFRHAP